MTIKQQGGIFGRNPTFSNVDVLDELNAGDLRKIVLRTFTGDVTVQRSFDAGST